MIDSVRHIRTFQGALWRVYPRSGVHPQAWDSLREFGPIPGMRFDPQPLPIEDHPGIGVMYAALSPVTALAEKYQETRVIDRHMNDNTLVGWSATRELELLDLTSNWPVANGGAAAIQMGDKAHTSTWSQAIYQEFGNSVDGLFHLSSVDGQPAVTLFSRSVTTPSFPTRPRFNNLLADPKCDAIILHTIDELNYAVV